MCDQDAKLPFQLHFGKKAFGASVGNRFVRRRLWDLARVCHCPVIGVCLPLAVLRKLVNKTLGGQALADEYEMHVGAVAECATRNRISEALHSELEQRYALDIRQFKSAKDSAALTLLWRGAVRQGDVAGPFWAALTHPRCDTALEDMLCREMHMIQHQAGAATRGDINRCHALLDENAVLSKELAKVQERCTRLLAEKAREIAQLHAQLQQSQAQVLEREGRMAALQQDLLMLQASLPDLASRLRMKQKLVAMQLRHETQEALINQLKHKLAGAQRLSDAREHDLPIATADTATPGEEPAQTLPAHLADKTILCVGGRNGNIASYRGIIEQVGGRFAHHDGGQEDNVSLLDASLAAADLVICQTGCISHNAYWRVKEHCKRTGKRCVFVDNPSTSSLNRGLAQIAIHEVTVSRGG